MSLLLYAVPGAWCLRDAYESLVSGDMPSPSPAANDAFLAELLAASTPATPDTDTLPPSTNGASNGRLTPEMHAALAMSRRSPGSARQSPSAWTSELQAGSVGSNSSTQSRLPLNISALDVMYVSRNPAVLSWHKYS
jgi:hypothetical protein